MSATISERELLEWMAYYSLEPWGGERADLSAGIIASTIANCHRDQQRTKPFEPKDFMAQYDRATADEPKPLSPEELKQELLSAFGHKIKRKVSANGGAV